MFKHLIQLNKRNFFEFISAKEDATKFADLILFIKNTNPLLLDIIAEDSDGAIRKVGAIIQA